MLKTYKLLCVLLFLFTPSIAIYDIMQYGAVKNSDTHGAQIVNQNAFMKAIQLANSTSQGERVIKVPKGTFYFMPVTMKNIFNVTIIIQGRMAASKLIKYWTKKQNNKDYQDFVSCTNCQYLTISGGGKIDGRGYQWWLICILNDKKFLPDQNRRPHLVNIYNSRFIKIHDITMKNSPQFNLRMQDCFDVELYNLNIKVNTTAQINLFKKFSLIGVIPLFPLNTDGIDPSGARYHIYNISVQNYDDVVVPKPSHQGSYGGNCTQDILVQNATVVLGVGMSIGSVPPNEGCNCIRNITFRNVYMIRPIKAIYVKTNPGDKGTGLVENIYYKNFTLDRPIWWAIYIGPQQQKEPDGGGPGCMLYPYDPKGTCETQPRVTLRNITLEDVNIHNSVLFPVVIRCNVSNPCTQINFRRVRTDKWFLGQKKTGHVCQYASGNGEGNQPIINCLEKKHTIDRNLKVEEIEMKNQKDLTLEQYKKVLEQLQNAATQIGYEEQDDEFDYDFDPYVHFGIVGQTLKRKMQLLSS